MTIADLMAQRDFRTVKRLLSGMTADELTAELAQLDPRRRAVAFRLLPKELAIDVFDDLPRPDRTALITTFTHRRVIDLLERMSPDDRADLLDEVPAKVADRILRQLSPEKREMTAVLLGYRAKTAGRIMTPEYVSLRRDMTVSEALRKIRRVGLDKETIYNLYVTDGHRRLEGVISLRDLVLSPPGRVVAELMTADPVAAGTDDDQEDVARLIERHDLLALPVTDTERRLVGIVTVDDAVDILDEEATEDFLGHAGVYRVDPPPGQSVRGERLVSGRIWYSLAARLPFLLITLAGGMIAGRMVAAFETELETIVALAFFIPLVMDMGGNVGTQSSTIFTRAVLLGDVRPDRIMKHIWRETTVGISMGLLLGIMAGVIAWLWQRSVNIAVVVGLALFFTITTASLLGFLVPWALMRLGVDHVPGSGPVITTIKDITGILIYFALATALLPQLRR